MADTLLPTTQAAARLGVNRKTVQRLVARGDLKPAHDLGSTRGYLFTPKALDAYREAHPLDEAAQPEAEPVAVA